MEDKIIQVLCDSGFTSRDGTWLAAPTRDVVRAVLALPSAAGGETVGRICMACGSTNLPTADRYITPPEAMPEEEAIALAIHNAFWLHTYGGETDTAIAVARETWPRVKDMSLAQARAVLALLPRCEAGGETIEQLKLENWQLKGALGYPVPGDIPQGDFKCGLCEARALPPSDGGEWNATLEQAALIADEQAKVHGQEQGTTVAGMYSPLALAAAHVNMMAVSNDISTAIRSLKRPPVPQEDD